MLELLLAAQGRVVSAEELLERVWDENADPFTGAVKVTISRLRAKLGDPPVIETVAKAGYRIRRPGARLKSRITQLAGRHCLAGPPASASRSSTAACSSLSGAALVAITYGLFERATEYRRHSCRGFLTLPPSRSARASAAGMALPQLASPASASQDQHR